MPRKNYTVDEVLRDFRKKRDIKVIKDKIFILKDKIYIKDNQGRMELTRNPNKAWDLGNGSWGKIDFLTNYNNYNIIRVKDFAPKTLKAYM